MINFKRRLVILILLLSIEFASLAQVRDTIYVILERVYPRCILVNIGSLDIDSTLSFGMVVKIYKNLAISLGYDIKFDANNLNIIEDDITKCRFQAGVGIMTNNGYFLFKAFPLGFEFGLAFDKTQLSPTLGISCDKFLRMQMKVGIMF